MYCFKTCYGTTCLENSELLDDDGTNHRIELEYYKTRNTKYNILGQKVNEYGIEILKKEYKNNEFNTEVKLINNISKNKYKVIKIINMLREYKVTPIILDDVVEDLLR